MGGLQHVGTIATCGEGGAIVHVLGSVQANTRMAMVAVIPIEEIPTEVSGWYCQVNRFGTYSALWPLSKLLILRSTDDRFRLQNPRILLNLTAPACPFRIMCIASYPWIVRLTA